ncbi:hypothetical protein GCM10010440_72560 [Kitasatospora cinereorecta]
MDENAEQQHPTTTVSTDQRVVPPLGPHQQFADVLAGAVVDASVDRQDGGRRGGILHQPAHPKVDAHRPDSPGGHNLVSWS